MAASYLWWSCFAVLCLGSCFAVRTPSPEDSIHLVPNIDYIGEVLTLWQVPRGPVKKILLILGGVNVNPYAFWDTSSNCPLCSGSPEHRKITVDALAKEYLVVVPRWNDGSIPEYTWADPLPVLSWFFEWRQVQGYKYNVPTVALGVSLGGEVMGILPNIHPGLFESLAFMVAAPSKNTFKDITSDYPPSMFLHMPKDKKREKHIVEAMSIFNSKGILTSDVPWHEHPITPDWFSQSIVGLDLPTSIAILKGLRRDGLVDEEDFLINDFGGREAREVWYPVLESWHVLPEDPNGEVGLHMMEDKVINELLIAFAMHTTISRMDDEMFRWFDGGYNDKKVDAFVGSS